MGLDLAELMTAVEDAFGFVIPEEDAAGLDTAGKVHEYVLAHRYRGKRQACLRSITFYKIRQAMMSVLHIPRKDVRASTELSAIIPRRRRRVWRALQRASGFRLPRLRRSAWVRAGTILAILGLAILVPLLLSLTLLNGAILVGILTALTVGYAFSWLTIPLEFEFHPECPTAGQLATATLARNYRAIVATADISASDAEVWQKLSSIVAEQLGVRACDITKDTDFVKDRVTVRPEIQRDQVVGQTWVAASLGVGEHAGLPLHYVAEHQ